MAGPGRATSGRPTLQTSSNHHDSNRLARTSVTNVVNLSPKTTIISEKAIELTTFVTPGQKSTQKTPWIDDVCNNTRRATRQHTRHHRCGGHRRCGGRRRVRRARAGFEIDHSERSSRVAISRAAGPDSARNTSGAASNKLNRKFRLSRRGGGHRWWGGRKRAWLRRPRAVAGPGRASRRSAEQRPGTTGVEGAGGSGGHGRASRSTTPSRRLACGDLAGGRARRRPEHQRSRKQQAQSQIQAAPPARTASGRAAAHGHTKQPGPTSQVRRRPKHQRRHKHHRTEKPQNSS